MSKADVQKKAADLEKQLNGKIFMNGSKVSEDDKKAFNELLGADNKGLHSWLARMGSKRGCVHAAAQVEPKLKGKAFLGGNIPSEEDVHHFRAILGANNVNLYRWVKNVASFSAEERKVFPAPQKPKGTTYSITKK